MSAHLPPNARFQERSHALPSPACGYAERRHGWRRLWGARRGVGGEGAFVFPRCVTSKRFRAPAGARVTFSLNGQRESNPRERPPRWRALQASCLPGARTGYGVFRRHVHVPAENWPESIRAILTDSPPPARRAIGAPGKAARSCAQRQQQQHPTPALPCTQGRETTAARSFPVAPASGAHDARLLFRGPSAAVRRGRQGRAAGESKDGLAFSRGHDARSKSPATTHALAGQDARQAPPRGALFSWLLLFWARKREVARAAAAARNRSETRAGAQP